VAVNEQEKRDRVFSVWGPRAYAWSGEERQRAAGFPIDPSGRQRVLGFPAGLPADPFWPVKRDWHPLLAHPNLAHPVRSYRQRRLRLSVPEHSESPPQV
jgi:hypothetical protein